MTIKMVDVTLHLDEDVSHEDREEFRDSLLDLNGVMAVASPDKKPHLVTIEYDPDAINSSEFVKAAQGRSLHAQLIGM
ncbi:MAG: ATP-binding protein [Gammaproteobacteria bacterium]